MSNLKNFLLTAIAATTVAFGFAAEPVTLKVIKKSNARKVPAATSQIISQTPQGTLLPDLIWTSKSAAPDQTGTKVQWSDLDGVVPTIVKNGNKMYIYNPINSLASMTAAWIEGEIAADGKSVAFKTPQAYFQNPDGYGGYTLLYATRLDASGKIDASNLDLVFSIDEAGNMQQTDGGVLALTNLDGGFYGYAESNISINKINEKLVELPEDAVISDYILNYSSNENTFRQAARIAVAGDDYYFSDPVRSENVWFKGTRVGNTITCDYGQYMGTQSGYPLYLTTANASYTTVTDPYFGITQEVIEYTLNVDQPILFEVDENGVISSKQIIFLNNSKRSVGTAYAAYGKPSYEPWTRELVTPATPEVTSYLDLNQYIDYGLMGCSILFDIKPYGENGEFIPQENMYYQITLDGKPFEIYETTMIPYFASFTDAELLTAIQVNGDSHQLQIPNNPKFSVGIQSFYVYGDEVYPSEIKTYPIVNGELVLEESAVEAIESNSEVISIEYYDLCGAKVNPDYKGVVICVKKFADGKVESSKIVK